MIRGFINKFCSVRSKKLVDLCGPADISAESPVPPSVGSPAPQWEDIFHEGSSDCEEEEDHNHHDTCHQTDSGTPPKARRRLFSKGFCEVSTQEVEVSPKSICSSNSPKSDEFRNLACFSTPTDTSNKVDDVIIVDSTPEIEELFHNESGSSITLDLPNLDLNDFQILQGAEILLGPENIGENIEEPDKSTELEPANIVNTTGPPETSMHQSLNGSRKRVRDQRKWKRNSLKSAKNHGNAYFSSRGKPVAAAKMRNACCCAKKCSLKLSENERSEIFSNFWKLGSKVRQWDFITRHSTCQPIKKKTTENQSSRRSTSRSYFFKTKSNNVKICKTMFLNTLGIRTGQIDSAYSHLKNSGSMSPDKRGKHPNRPKKMTEEQKASAVTHINEYPRVPAHYVQAKSKREYLENGLSIAKMYRHYKEWCHINSVPMKNQATKRQYRVVLNCNFNLGFFKPKKDQCHTYNVIKTCTRAQREVRKDSWIRHLANKKAARKEKAEAKALGAANKKVTVCVFDLQKVLPLPKSETSVFFYKNKLSLFNFTVYEMTKHLGICYLWHEAIAKRGANEISSLFLDFVSSCVAEGSAEIHSFSDSCSGQNKNRYFFSMMVFAAAKYSLKLKHCFLEPGHTQNEGDSVHARIESEAAGREIFDFEEWEDIITSAKQEEPKYKAIRVSRKMVFNFHSLVSMQNWTTDTQGKKVSWSKVKIVEASFENIGMLQFKYDYDGPTYSLDTKAKRRGHPLNLKTYSLSEAYQGRIPLKDKKIKHLNDLCKSLAIPSKYHDKYKDYMKSVDPVEENEEVYQDEEEPENASDQSDVDEEEEQEQDTIEEEQNMDEEGQDMGIDD